MIYAINFFIILQVILTVLIGWHGVVTVFGLIRKKEPRGQDQPQNRFAVIVCARNEENVIVHLLRSLGEQDYPKDKWHVYLLADHCTDRTVDIARSFPFVT
ncbi:MAG: glycosyltransferase, partial [Lachnospiraceae bacterium]|nr:glycosyltransferase [Lachnospiraceae bacterium]